MFVMRGEGGQPRIRGNRNKLVLNVGSVTADLRYDGARQKQPHAFIHVLTLYTYIKSTPNKNVCSGGRRFIIGLFSVWCEYPKPIMLVVLTVSHKEGDLYSVHAPDDVMRRIL